MVNNEKKTFDTVLNGFRQWKIIQDGEKRYDEGRRFAIIIERKKDDQENRTKII